MTNLNDTLPELMRRATDTLEPESVDLLDRTVKQGLGLRRRRTVLLRTSGAAAALATVGVIAAGTHLLGTGTTPDAPAAGTPSIGSPSAKPATTAADPLVGTSKQNLAILKSALAADGLHVSGSYTWDGPTQGQLAALWVANDGKGASMIQVITHRFGYFDGCKELGPTCRIRPDGSAIATVTNLPESRGKGIVRNGIDIIYKDGRSVTIDNYNGAAEKGSVSRPRPALTVAQLTKLADDTSWKYPVQGPKERGRK